MKYMKYNHYMINVIYAFMKVLNKIIIKILFYFNDIIQFLFFMINRDISLNKILVYFMWKMNYKLY